MKKLFIMVVSLSLIFMQSVGADDTKYEKHETVRITSDANGHVTEVKVEDWLKIFGDDNINDYSTLTDIKNIEGDEEYKADGHHIIWDNKGSDITYEGISDGELPVEVKITYYLDGKEVKVDDLKGKSGKVKIRFDYTNNLVKSETVDGHTYNVHVPFVCASGLMLDSEKFSNVTVSQGKVMESSDQSIVLGVSIPGLKSDLNLSDDISKDIDLDDYVEVEADVTDFELDLTATVVSTVGIDEIEDMDDIDDLIDGMSTLTNASNELLSGSSELSTGMKTMNNYLNQYYSGVNSLANGIDSLNDSLKTLTTNKETLDEGIDSISKELETLNSTLDNISTDEDNEELKEKLNDLINNSSELLNQITIMKSTIEQVNTFINNMKEYQTNLETYNSTVKNYIDSITLDDISTHTRKIKEIIDSSELTDEQKNTITSELSAIDNTVSANQEALKNAKETLNSTPEITIPDLNDIDFTAMNELLNQIEQNKDIINDYSEVLDGYDSVDDMMSELKNGLSQITSMTSGVTALSQAIDSIYEGTQQLSTGANSLVSAQSQLKQGYSSLTTGMDALNSGLEAFSDGLKEFSSDEIKDMTRRFKALQKAESEYYNYSGIADNVEGSVLFIYESDEIK